MQRLTENVMQLGNRHFNYFVVGQQEAVVIECGVTGGVISFHNQWVQLPTRPNIKYLLAMHAHFDHVCGIPALKGMFPASKLLGSKEAQKVLSKSKIMEDLFGQDRQMSEVLINEGILKIKATEYTAEPIILDQIIGEGEEIKLTGNLTIKVLDAPGHSPCSLACYLPGEQFMFLSDAAGFQISDEEIFPIFFQGYEAYMETIKRLMGFPTLVLGVPHERVWTGKEVNYFYQRALESAREVFNIISHRLNDGWNEEKIKETLFLRYYRGNLQIYTPQNINTCIDLLIRRVKECL